MKLGYYIDINVVLVLFLMRTYTSDTKLIQVDQTKVKYFSLNHISNHSLPEIKLESMSDIEMRIKKTNDLEYTVLSMNNDDNIESKLTVWDKLVNFYNFSTKSPSALPQKTPFLSLKVFFFFFLWYFFTVVYNYSNKLLLNHVPLPFTTSALQLFLGIPIFLPLWMMKPLNYNWDNVKLHAKIATMHGLGNCASVIAFGAGSVGFAHVVKALEPVFAALLSALVLNQYFPYFVYLSLMPIVVGVAVASANEVTFTWLGFLSAMASNLFYQMRIVLAKQEIENETIKISPANLFRVITIIASIEMIPLALLIEGYRVPSVLDRAFKNGSTLEDILSNLLISGASYYMYNEVAFWLLDIIHPISHAVGNTLKRVVIILVSIFMLKSPVNAMGMSGASIAVAGTLLYSLAQLKYKSHH